jgi:hypothetical protein
MTEVFHGFPQSLQATARTALRPWPLLPHPFQFIIHQPFIRCYVVYVTDKTSLNEPQIDITIQYFVTNYEVECLVPNRLQCGL